MSEGAPVRIWLLGGIRSVNSGGLSVSFSTRKSASLFGYLACHLGKDVPRDTLIATFWPEANPSSGRNSLSVALSLIRKQIELNSLPEQRVLSTDFRFVRLTGEVWCDLDEFTRTIRRSTLAENSAARAELLAKALDLYEGPLMHGDPELWTSHERFRVEQMYIESLCHFMDMARTLPEIHRALNYAAKALAWYPDSRDLLSRVQRLRHKVNIEEDAIYRKQRLHEAHRMGEDASSAALRMFERSEGDALVDADAPGGAVALGSPFYIERDTDKYFLDALLNRESIVLIRAPRLTGKTSLLARGLHQGRFAGSRVAMIDFQALDGASLSSSESFLRVLAHQLSDQLGLAGSVSQVWDPDLGATMNFERFLRHVLADGAPLIVGFDEVDRIFGYGFSESFFGLLRSWYNRRALEPDGPWSRFTLALTYSTEAHLFVKDLNQSPFNVGKRLALHDFNPVQVAELNRRYGLPLKNSAELGDFIALLGGHPYLVRTGFRLMVQDKIPPSVFLRNAPTSEGPYADHLQRLWSLLNKDGSLVRCLREALAQGSCPDPDGFYRLRAAGLIIGESTKSVKTRCGLYEAFIRTKVD